MTIHTMTSREFGENPDRAKEVAKDGPVFIAEEGQSTHVLLTMESYEKLGGEMSLADALADRREGADFDFDPPRLQGPLARRVDFS